MCILLRVDHDGFLNRRDRRSREDQSRGRHRRRGRVRRIRRGSRRPIE